MLLAWIPLLPLLGFLVNGVWYLFGQAPQGRKAAHATVPGLIATFAIGGAFVVALSAFFRLLEMPEESRVITEELFSWIQVAGLSIPATLRVDALSTLFTLVITGVGTLIHIYSIGYMGHDETPGKFFAYLNLFCFAMLVLVLGASLPLLFLGWEGVGLCSYLLIGYWYTDIEKAKAGKKAFVVNRVGDFGFLLGMFLIYTTFGSLAFDGIHPSADIAPATLNAIALLLFVGCMGKSAQIPLYIWLPDAMAGPTPVSALIHAATMVTSGIYMIARLNSVFSMAPEAMHVIAVVGGVTAFFAATIALVQSDIKKVLAYSTVSQLGYMFLACGVGATGAGVFHVITHAFFKALLFLGAGSVIHGMHEEQNIWKMGGLRKAMPKTFLVFAIGWLAICGIPPFSGFFSKDEILWMSFSSPHGSTLLWALGAATAMMTAFYMTRLFVLTFLGAPRWKAAHAEHGHSSHGGEPHESPWVMIAPLAVLAVLSALGGLIGIPHMSWLDHWLHHVVHHSAELAPGVDPSMEWILMGVSVAGAVVGISVAWFLYSQPSRVEGLAKGLKPLHRLLENKWYVDEIYEWLIIKPIRLLSQGLWRGVDVGLIDRVVVGFGKVSEWTGQAARTAQTGSLQVYAFVLLLGAVSTVGYLIYGLAR